jgi:hypothetical protein
LATRLALGLGMLTHTRFASSGVTGLSKLIVGLRLAADTARHVSIIKRRPRTALCRCGGWGSQEQKVMGLDEALAALAEEAGAPDVRPGREI